MNFPVNQKEFVEMVVFERRHNDLHKNITVGAIGGTFTYSFTPTSIGTAILIKCNLCNKEQNVTDYTCW